MEILDKKKRKCRSEEYKRGYYIGFQRNIKGVFGKGGRDQGPNILLFLGEVRDSDPQDLVQIWTKS
jgi:hypothetical protein